MMKQMASGRGMPKLPGGMAIPGMPAGMPAGLPAGLGMPGGGKAKSAKPGKGARKSGNPAKRAAEARGDVAATEPADSGEGNGKSGLPDFSKFRT